jgi:CRP/FNR family transcriptional regulator/CRP/FNR family cyclic AMP-dependent transcriptional regulator
MAIKELLSTIPLFEGLSSTDLDIVAQRVRPRRYKENDTIFHKDDPGVALYAIVEGKVKIHNETPDGQDCIITIFSEGEFFGDLSMIDGNPRSADATTMEPSELLMLTRDDLMDILDRYPRITRCLLVTIAGRLRRTTELLVKTTTLDVNGRLAMQLNWLAEQHGRVTTQGIRIDLHLTQTDLGNLVGASRESVNKVLGYFRRMGWISLEEGNRITIKDQRALERVCESR